MVMSQRKKIVIPCISSINLLPNIADLHLNLEKTDYDTDVTRETYAMIVLLLFYPFRDKEDLVIDGSYWKKYELVSSTKLLSKKIYKYFRIYKIAHTIVQC